MKKKKIIFKLIFVMGFLVAMYPLVTRIYYRVEVKEQVKDFDDATKKIDKEEIKKRVGLAKAYNDSLSNAVTNDPYDEKRKKAGRKAYAKMLEVNEQIGHVEIPKIAQDIPVYAGTNETILQKGCGHMEGTSLPIGGNNTHSVLTAHSGLPTARLFTDLKELKEGDKFYVHNIEDVIAYQVDEVKIVDPGDFSDLLVSPGHDYCTLLTCTPVMVNSHRLLVRGHRVKYVPAIEEKIMEESRNAFWYRWLFYISIVVIIILLLIIKRQRRKRKKLLEKVQNKKEESIE